MIDRRLDDVADVESSLDVHQRNLILALAVLQS